MVGLAIGTVRLTAGERGESPAWCEVACFVFGVAVIFLGVALLAPSAHAPREHELLLDEDELEDDEDEEVAE